MLRSQMGKYGIGEILMWHGWECVAEKREGSLWVIGWPKRKASGVLAPGGGWVGGGARRKGGKRETRKRSEGLM